MMAPFSKVFEWGDVSTGLIAVLLGVGFGYFLEKAGFGSAKKLAGVWYGYDFAVIRVMFSAIIVSLVGLYGLHYVGFLDLNLVYINTTYYWPQIVGGFIFGIGFNVGSYCPGTSAVACATGKTDGIVFTGGFLVGVLGFALAFPLFENFFNSSNAGQIKLNDVIGLPDGVIVLGIVLIAAGAFAVTHILDKKFGNKG